MNPAIWLARSAALTPDAPAILCGTAVLSDYRGFADQAARLGAGLSARGIGPGDRVALFMTNGPEYLVALFGSWMAGAAVVPVNAKLHPAELAWILGDSGAALVIASEDLAPGLAGHLPEGLALLVPGGADWESLLAGPPLERPAERAGGELVWLFYTSGTTGRPKGVMITADNLLAMVEGYFTDVDSVGAGDATLYAAPMSHGAGLYALPHVLKGARHVIPPSGGFEPAEILDLAEALGNLHLFAAPTMVRRLVAEARTSGRDGAGLKTIVYGGGPMYLADIEEAVAVLGPRFVQIYGQGESPMTITALPRDLVSDRAHPRWRERLGSVGRAFAGLEVRIADAAGAEVPPGTLGEILVRGRIVMGGYWANPAATAKAVRDGWLWTGDMGSMDDEGFVTLRDRSKDVIISGGSNIYPREVEEALLTHPAVAEVACIGRPHADWGEEVVAFVVLEPGQAAGAGELDGWLLDRIARFKRPKHWHFVESLPKNNYGKVLKTALRDRV